MKLLLALLALVSPKIHAQLIGYEPFDYTSTIVDADGGSFWDFRNQITGQHTGNASDWDLAPGFAGATTCSGGQLFTGDSGISREYGGTTVTAQGEGAITDSAARRKVYYRITMTRGTSTTWCGVSSFDLGVERVFFGLFPGQTNFAIYDQNTLLPIVVSTVPVNVGVAYTLVAKLDYDANIVSLYVNPDIDGTEASNTPVATATYTGPQRSTAIRVASGGSGLAQWDDLTCATTWESLRTYEVTTSADSGTGSLANAALFAGTTGGRVTFPHAGAIYAVISEGTGQRLIRFNRNQPGTLTLDIPITGFTSTTERVTGMDFRTEGNGLLYALCIRSIPGDDNDVGRLCILNTSTGALTNVGSGPFLTNLSNDWTRAGFDFEYRRNSGNTEAVIRITPENGLNYRLNAINGLVEAIDTPLTQTSMNGVASDAWTERDDRSTVYGIDLSTERPSLWRIGGIGGNPSASGGTLTRIGPLNLPAIGDARNGFDIAENGQAYLVGTRPIAPSEFGKFLHQVDLKTGATTQIGQIASGSGFIAGMSVASSKINATSVSNGLRDTIIDGGSHGGQVHIGFTPTMDLVVNANEALALRKIQIESANGIVQTGGLLSADGCTFYRCTGGAIVSLGGNLKLEHCTFVENTAVSGGAVRIDSATATARVNHCTFTKNRSTGGGGAIRLTAGTLELSACIVAENISDSSVGPDIWNSGTLTATACVIGNATDSTITETVANRNDTGTLVAPVAHNLAPLADYGGATWTMPPNRTGSAINRARTTNFTGDQRGFLINEFPDSGAAEYRGNQDLGLFWNTDWDHDGNTYGIEAAVGTDPNVPDAGDPKNLRVMYEAGLPVLRFFQNPTVRPFTRWQLKRSTDLINFNETIFSFDGPSLASSLALGLINDSVGSNIILRDNVPNPAKLFYRLEATLAP